MSRTAARLNELGLILPPPMQAPGGIKLPFPWINVRGDRVIISGHGPQNSDGALAGPFGKVGADVTLEQLRTSRARSASRSSAACSASLATWTASRAGCASSAW